MPSRAVRVLTRARPGRRSRPQAFAGALASVIVALLLAGCAAQFAYRDGKELVAQGKVEEGLAKFREALEHEPRSTEFRAAYVQTREQIVAGFLEQGDRLAAAANHADATRLYQRVLAIDPGNERARAGLRSVESSGRHAQLLKEADAAWAKKDAETAQLKLRGILTEQPNHAGALALSRTIAEKTAAPAVEPALSVAYRKPITIEFKDVALKQIFEVIARTSGLNFLFDKDVKTDQKTSIFLKNSTIASAVHFTLLTNQLEQQVLDANTILIYPNAAAKQKDYQEMVVRTFYLSNADAKTVANTLKTIVKSRDVIADDKLNMVIVRDGPDAIRLAEKLVALHDVPEPEVMLEVEIIEIKRTRLLELGVKWPDSLTLTPLPSAAGGTLTVRDLQTNLNGGTVGAGIGPLVVNARKQDTDANILANPRIRARNREKAKILIGERVPNITTTATSTGFVSESVNYVDVGLKLEVEPVIYLDNQVAIKVALEVSNIVSQLQTKSGSVAYQIGTRTASTVLRLNDGENQVLAGLINDEDRRSASKVPLLGEIPLVGRLFGNTGDDSQKTEIVLSITPRLIRNIQRPDAALAEFRAGTDSSFRNRPDAAVAAPAAPLGGAAPQAAVPVARTADGAPSTAPPATGGGTPAIGGTGNAPAADAALQWQGPDQVKAGSTFNVQLTMQSGQSVTSLPMVVGFDPNVLQVATVAEGLFLKQGGAATSFTSRIEPNGRILMTGTRTGAGGATAPEAVATITFRALTAGRARVELLSVAPVGLGGRAITAALPAALNLQVQP